MSNASRRRTDTVTIFIGDYLSRIKHLEARAEALEEAHDTPRMLDEVPEYLAVAKEHDDLVAEAEKAATVVLVQAPRRSAWKRLLAEHPPRTDESLPKVDVQVDEVFGFNTDTLPEGLAKLAILEVNEGGETREWSKFAETEMDDFLDDLAEIDFRRIWQTAVALIRSVDADPKASLHSRMSQGNDETLN